MRVSFYPKSQVLKVQVVWLTKLVLYFCETMFVLKGNAACAKDFPVSRSNDLQPHWLVQVSHWSVMLEGLDASMKILGVFWYYTVQGV